MSRKLDAAIAEALGYEKVFVDTRFMPSDTFPHIGVWKYFTGDGWAEVPRYSTDGNAMLELDKEMRARGWMLVVVRNMEKEGASARYYQGGQVVTFPLPTKHKEIETAVALTAYKALTGKEWQD